MKFSYAPLALLTTNYSCIEPCDVPHVPIVVQDQGRSALGTQQAVEFVVPLYTDCDYQSSGAPVAAGGKSVKPNHDHFADLLVANEPAPATAIAAMFPGDAFEFVDADGLSLDRASLKQFLTFTGDMFDANTLLELVICTATGTDGTQYSFGPIQDFLFDDGASVNVASYQCAVSFGA